ncbi:MAG: hypothetical protein LBR35_00775 [Rickettsiales bacterium]|jgi:hypothetical protein|nr:hypothetical protein [Rickettsiales bacterium]
MDKITYIANGITSEFAFNFKIFKPQNLEVYVNGLKQEGGFHVQLDSIGGYVIFSAPPANNSKIVILRNLEIERQVDFQECGAVEASDLNHDLDYILELLHQTNAGLTNCVRNADALNDIDTALPKPKAGYALVWNDDEKKLINSKIDILKESLATTHAYEETKKIFENIQNLLNYTSDGTALGLVLNMINVFKEMFPNQFEDFGDILDSGVFPDQYYDYGQLPDEE